MACLLLSIPAALALATRAEGRLGGTSPPARWRTAALCALAIALASCARPLPSRLACGIACIALAVAAFGDARTGYLFDAVTLPAAAATALAAALCGQAASAAAGVLVIVGGFGAVFAGSRGRLIGLGDVKAMYALGAAFGPGEAFFAIFAACVSGIAAAALAGRLRAGAELRFGPHLAAGSVCALLVGDPFVHRVLGL
jgi:prepilin signal peptidase PulO-like enzyme (type II secretory pathway)